MHLKRLAAAARTLPGDADDIAVLESRSQETDCAATKLVLPRNRYWWLQRAFETGDDCRRRRLTTLEVALRDEFAILAKQPDAKPHEQRRGQQRHCRKKNNETASARRTCAAPTHSAGQANRCCVKTLLAASRPTMVTPPAVTSCRSFVPCRSSLTEHVAARRGSTVLC